MAAKKTAKSPFSKKLASIAKTIAKARPSKLYSPLFGAFVVFAGAADTMRAGAVVDWMYGGRVPAPTDVASAFSTSAIDGFCFAAGLGDKTGGLPHHEPTCPSTGPLAERVDSADAMIRARLTRDAYGGAPPTDDAWMVMPARDPWRRNDRWRRIQKLVVDGAEQEALRRLGELLGEMTPADRGAGYGDELVLAMDLALRHGADARVGAWLARHGHRLASEAFLLEEALCMRAIAARIAAGVLRETIGLSEEDRAGAMTAIDEALTTSLGAAPKTAVPKVQKRRVSCEYSQVQLGPEKLDDEEKAQVHFQKPDDSKQGMSLFPTMVGVATPTETDYVDAEVTVSARAASPNEGAVQAVAFPLTVRGPLLLRSATGDEDEPILVVNGVYDVLAQFLPKKAPKASAESGLRVFKLLLSFHPVGSLKAPRTFEMEES